MSFNKTYPCADCDGHYLAKGLHPPFHEDQAMDGDDAGDGATFSQQAARKKPKKICLECEHQRSMKWIERQLKISQAQGSGATTGGIGITVGEALSNRSRGLGDVYKRQLFIRHQRRQIGKT